MFIPIPIEEFKRRTEINGATELLHPWERVGNVVSLRDLVSIEAVQIMQRDYLAKLMRHIVLEGGNHPRVYEECSFHIVEMSPHAGLIGQTFVEKSKCASFLSDGFRKLLDGFCSSGGITKIGAAVVLGKTKENEVALAHYIPPIMEMNGSTRWALLDGIHRNFVTDATGNTTTVIAIEGVKEVFPCQLHAWNDIHLVDEKPPEEERFFDLRPELFRDLKHVGIDG